eukprot:m.163369 g.163369  ORF g.163369 m.163369 type:complete len:151 (-) comp53080_c0_seq2:45-497(-)
MPRIQAIVCPHPREDSLFPFDSLLLQALCDVSVVKTFDRARFLPTLAHPPIPPPQVVLIKITPKLDPSITEETVLYLDYVVRMLTHAKQKGMQTSLKTLGPGGDELARLANLDPSLTPFTMTPDDYRRLVAVFAKWPSRPSRVTAYAGLE